MKIIKEICKDIECALDKAEHYAKQAIILKPRLSFSGTTLFSRFKCNDGYNEWLTQRSCYYNK